MKFKCSLAFYFWLFFYKQISGFIYSIIGYLMVSILFFLPFLINSHWVKHKNESINLSVKNNFYKMPELINERI